MSEEKAYYFLLPPWMIAIDRHLLKDTLDKKLHWTANLHSCSRAGEKLFSLIQEKNQILLAGSRSLAEWVKIYVSLQELGISLRQLERENQVFSPEAKEEWVSLTNMALEISYSADFQGGVVFETIKKAYNELLKRNRSLIVQNPPNIFLSLGYNLRGSLEGLGVVFLKANGKIYQSWEADMSALLMTKIPETNFTFLDLMVKRMECPWLKGESLIQEGKN